MTRLLARSPRTSPAPTFFPGGNRVGPSLVGSVMRLPSLLFLSGLAQPLLAQGDVRQLRLSPNALVVQDTATASNLTAVRTGTGLLVIDNFLFRSSMRAALRVLEREFPNAIITHAINTHGHDDQTWGNQLLPDSALSIGHVNTVRYMRERIRQMESFFARGPAIASALEVHSGWNCPTPSATGSATGQP